MKALSNKLSNKTVIHIAAATASLVLSLLPVGAQTLTNIDLADAVYTRPTSISETGVVIGSYMTKDRAQGAFINDHGTVTTFTAEGNAVPTVTSVNRNKTVVGWYNDSRLEQHGFIRLPAGRVKEIKPANADATYPRAVDDRNNVAGYFRDTNSNIHGFVLNGSRISVLDFPDAISTCIVDQNALGVAVGFYQDVNGLSHGFTWSASSGFVRIDFPGAIGTQLLRIDEDGRMIGEYALPSKVASGFVVELNGQMSTISPPAFPSSYLVSFVGKGGVLGGVGKIDGDSTSFANGRSGFYLGQTGQYSSLSSLGVVQFLDGNSSGSAVGYYTDAANTLHAFLVDLNAVR